MRYKIFSSLLFLCLFYLTLYSQEATTTWPYLYNNFKPGVIYFTNGSKQESLVNVHILNSKLHYLDQESIKEAFSKNIMVVTIGGEQFYIRDNKMLKVVASNEQGFIGEWAEADMASLSSGATAAYGASANSMAIRKLSSVEGGTSIATVTHMQLKNEKENGQILPIQTSFYIVTKGQVYPANRKQLEKTLPEDKGKELKSFLKKEKISWKDPESLMKLVSFINE